MAEVGGGVASSRRQSLGQRTGHLITILRTPKRSCLICLLFYYELR